MVVREATCTETGEYQVTCTVCGEVKTVTVEADGHEDADGNGVCDVCGKDLNAPSASGICDKCGKDHGDKVGGLFGYNGFICKLLAFFRSLTKLFNK